MPSGNSAASTALASAPSRASASMPIQKTRAERAVGKKPVPRKLRSNPLLVTVSRALRISSNCCVSPMNFRVTCSDSSRTQRGSGANSRTPSMKRAMRWRISSAMSRATKRRMILAISCKFQAARKTRPTSPKPGRSGAPTVLSLHQLPSHHIQCLLAGIPADAVAVTGKVPLYHFRLFSIGQRVINQAHGFLLAAAGGAGHASDAHAQRGFAFDANALGHGHGDFAADRAMLGDDLRRHAGKGSFQMIGIDDGAAEK